MAAASGSREALFDVAGALLSPLELASDVGLCAHMGMKAAQELLWFGHSLVDSRNLRHDGLARCNNLPSRIIRHPWLERNRRYEVVLLLEHAYKVHTLTEGKNSNGTGGCCLISSVCARGGTRNTEGLVLTLSH